MELAVSSLGGICAREWHICVPRMRACFREAFLGWGGTGVGREAWWNRVPEPTPQLDREWPTLRDSCPSSHPWSAPVRQHQSLSWQWSESKCTEPSPLLHPRPIMTCLLFIYVIHMITFTLFWLKMSYMDMNNLILPFFVQFPVWLESEKNTKTGEATPRSNLSCHDSSLWDTEMFRLPAKQNCWMWTFGWKIKRLRGMQKGSTSHIPRSSESNQMALTP